MKIHPVSKYMKKSLIVKFVVIIVRFTLFNYKIETFISTVTSAKVIFLRKIFVNRKIVVHLHSAMWIV